MDDEIVLDDTLELETFETTLVAMVDDTVEPPPPDAEPPHELKNRQKNQPAIKQIFTPLNISDFINHLKKTAF
jgi:hypothetical protein